MTGRIAHELDGHATTLFRYERFIRPTGLRFKKANVTHPELQTTFQLDILGVKKNPSSTMYTQLGVMTKGAIIEVRQKKRADMRFCVGRRMMRNTGH